MSPDLIPCRCHYDETLVEWHVQLTEGGSMSADHHIYRFYEISIVSICTVEVLSYMIGARA